MQEETEQKNKKVNAVVATAPVADISKPSTGQETKRSFVPRQKNSFGSRGRGGGRGGRKDRDDKRYSKPELDSAILSIRRVARVVSGGRRFSFSVYMVVGNKKGSVGVGTGKAGDTALAIEKATKAAKKNLIKIDLTDSMSIPCETRAKYCSAVVELRPAQGRGMVAGSAVRTVLSLAGIKDVNAKVMSRSKNKINNARATIEALKKIKTLCNSTK